MIQPPDHVPAAPRIEADPRLEGQIEARREELERQIDDRIAELQREVEALNGALDALEQSRDINLASLEQEKQKLIEVLAGRRSYLEDRVCDVEWERDRQVEELQGQKERVQGELELQRAYLVEDMENERSLFEMEVDWRLQFEELERNEELDRFNAKQKARLDEFDVPELKDYKKLKEDIMILFRHQMSDSEEKLASEFLRLSSSSWERLQQAVTSCAANGGKTLIELRALATSPDRNIRRDAYEREKTILKEHEVALAYSLNGVKGTTLMLEKRRGWSSPLERSLFQSRTTRKALDALIHAIEKSIPTFRSYMGVKARLLGLEKLSWYDIMAPVGKAKRSYTFKEAEDIVISAFSSFSKEMGEFAASAFKNGWIDAEPRKGKVGGAYDTAFRKSGCSRVLLNYDYTYDGVSTLAHELGHAYHDHTVMDLPPLLSDYPMTLAESASIFSETLVFSYLTKRLEREESLPIIEQFVSSANQTCLDILSRFYFESAVFERRREGELSASEFSAMMLSAQERTYGDAVSDKHEYMWAVKSHYYSESFSFYNYPYAFGELFALSLFSRKDKDPLFLEKYDSLLLRSGMDDVKSVAGMAGFDIEDKSFWLSGLAVIEKYIKELESWT